MLNSKVTPTAATTEPEMLLQHHEMHSARYNSKRTQEQLTNASKKVLTSAPGEDLTSASCNRCEIIESISAPRMRRISSALIRSPTDRIVRVIASVPKDDEEPNALDPC